MRDGHLIPGPAREILGISGKWLVYSIFIAAALCGIFYVLGLRELDLILIIWSSIVASSIFAVPYEDHWEQRLYRVLFSVSASLVITSLILLTVSVLTQNLLEYHISSSLMIPAIFISGIVLAIVTRDFWSLEKFQTIKGLAIYAILGETMVLALGEAVAHMADVELWVRGILLAAVIIIIVLSGLAIIRTMGDEWKPW